jgi:hypothetical protein
MNGGDDFVPGAVRDGTPNDNRKEQKVIHVILSNNDAGRDDRFWNGAMVCCCLLIFLWVISFILASV